MKQTETPGLPAAAYLRLAQVLQLLPVGKSTWWQWVKDGRAPASVKLSPRVTAWKASDIRAFLDAH